MATKMTTMVLNTVDLQCSSCYKKVKKVLCKFPGIRDQVYDEKNNKVTIKVLCCDPEKFRDKLCCKGRKVIKSIQIVDEAPKTKGPEPEKSKVASKEVVKPKEQETTKAPEKSKDEKPKGKPPAEKPADKSAEKPKPPAEKPTDKSAEKPKPPAEKPAEPVPVCGPVHGFPPMPMYPNGACCGSCAQGHGGGPCYQGYGGRPVPPPPGPCYDYGRPVPPPPGPCYDYGRPVPPPPGPCYDYGRPVPPPPGPCYDYGRPVYDYGYGYRGSKCCVSTDYFSEENPQGCTIM